MNIMSKTLLIFLMLIVIGFTQVSDGEPSISQLNTFQEGEYLQYRVGYLFLRVGTLKIYNEGKMEKYGHYGNYVRTFVDSNPKIFFITIHDVYETIMNDDSEPIYFLAHEDKGDYILKTIYDFDYDARNIHVLESKIYKKGFKEVQTADSLTAMENVYRDAISLLFFARTFCSEKKENQTIYTIAMARKEKCAFKVSGLRKEIEVKDIDFDTYYLDGNIKFIGIAGLKDGFKGWFSNDGRRVPLKAHMKAIFGSVKIELEKFARWDSPVAEKFKIKKPEMEINNDYIIKETPRDKFGLYNE